ncbi:hypothetical protein VTP01DRAFT_9897 [Rhizomucor pusillus]|uniref:uncharacterized protein n=1 Tax=Rhizomucor pusillus TaxID=4840 RepID=UPI0037433BD3
MKKKRHQTAQAPTTSVISLPKLRDPAETLRNKRKVEKPIEISKDEIINNLEEIKKTVMEKNKFLVLKQVPAGTWEENDKQWHTLWHIKDEQVQISWGSIDNVANDDSDGALRDSENNVVDYRTANVLLKKIL